MILLGEKEGPKEEKNERDEVFFHASKIRIIISLSSVIQAILSFSNSNYD